MKGNKTILGSILVISLVSIILAGSYTGAFFKDVETSEDNSFSAGLLDMKIKDNGEWSNGVTGTWTATDMKPGDEENFYAEFIDLMRTLESIDADHTEITCDYSVEDTCDPSDPDYLESDTDCDTDDTPDEMAKEMIITRCVFKGNFGCIDCLTGKRHAGYNGTHCAGSVSETNPDWKIKDTDGDGKQTFYDLKEQEIDNLPPVINNPDSVFQMSVKFDEDAGNDFQGDTFNLTMKFILNQDSSQ